MKIMDAYADFTRNYLEVRQYSKITIEGYWWSIRSFVRVHGNLPISNLTEDIINEWIHNMNLIGNSRSTIATNLCRFKVFLGYLEMYGDCKISMRSINVPKPTKTLPKYVSPQMVEKLIQNAVNVRDRAIIALLFSSGLRSAELRSLQKKDIDGKSIMVQEGKGLRDRVTYIDDRTRKYLDIYLSSRYDHSPYVFVSNRATQMSKSTLRYIVKKVCDDAKVPHLSPHMFRHGIATHLLDKGMNVRMIQKFLGHSDLTTTQVYLHVKDKDLMQAHSECLDKSIRKSLTKA